MRIIAGSAGSIPLKVPRTLTRPTTDRVREAIFSIIGPAIVGARVLDLFAGSGSLGLEALSRGALEATFVESNAAACTIISENLRKARLDGGHVQRRDVLSFLSTAGPARYDLIFADPPYARDEISADLLKGLLTGPSLAGALAADGLLVVESFADAPLPETPLLTTTREKTYGKTRVSFLTPSP